MAHTKNMCTSWEDMSSRINSIYLRNRKIMSLIINYIFDETIKSKTINSKIIINTDKNFNVKKNMSMII